MPTPQPDWVAEVSSGFDGFRCRNCATWVYENAPRVCDCNSEGQLALDGNPRASVSHLNKLRNDLFDAANSWAGDDQGNAAVHLHQAANSVLKALRCIERGNPTSESPPLDAVMAAMGAALPRTIFEQIHQVDSHDHRATTASISRG